ncbi:MAG: alpha/beta hydrolase [Dehalococcoidia bacterium]|nr:alpha/beta hydrolase [Dehalococcoidia bacterium]
MPFAPVNGIELYYETHGSGPPLVFAHGAGGNHLSWWQQVPVFSKQYRCIIFDHRAFGRSRDGEGEEKRGRTAFHDDLRALLDLLEIERPAIVAQSMGGRTAVGFALRNPGRCRAMVLAGTTGGAVTDDVRALQKQHRASELGQLPLLRRAVAPALKQRAPSADFLYRSIARLNPPRPKDFLAPPLASYRGSSAARLAEAGFPVLFLVGEHDAITPPAIIEQCHRAVARSAFEVIPDSGHSAYFEQPAAFNAAVLRFLQAADGDG